MTFPHCWTQIHRFIEYSVFFFIFFFLSFWFSSPSSFIEAKMKKKEMQMEEGGKNVVMETFGNYDT